ncbi:hypothetical protein ABZ371_16435 [Streptomyces sp. NPDC005899]|uniref:hypothetical protein n=1 Tax=Streptomyces sp. NPDC005899 TaxID=3155716 RepID=UPI0033EC199F
MRRMVVMGNASAAEDVGIPANELRCTDKNASGFDLAAFSAASPGSTGRALRRTGAPVVSIPGSVFDRLPSAPSAPALGRPELPGPARSPLTRPRQPEGADADKAAAPGVDRHDRGYAAAA